MEIANLIIQVVDLLSPSLARKINYIRNVSDNMKELEKKMGELAGLDKDVRDKVASAQWKAKKPMEVVNNWLKNVEEMKSEVNEIKNKLEETRRCLPYCCSQRKIGKRTLRLIKEVNDLYKKGSFEVVVIASQPPATVQVMPTTSLVSSTADQKIKVVWDLLMEGNTGIIGIYGMGGVGKTTVMENINNQLESTKKFDIVVWVTVSKDFNLKRLQSAIADRINLPKDLDEKALSIQLHEALRGKKFLLVLDDMWRPISLEQVGIPKPSIGNGCKVVLTTRSRRVCRSMEANKIIVIKKLSDEEAWWLFKEKVGATALGDSDVEVVARQVANECDGLPLALITIGRDLRDVNEVGHWRHALHQLKNSKPEIGEMEDEVIKILHFSYQHLKNDNLRACFLYCSLFPEDYRINKGVLINLWTCEGLIEEDGEAQTMVDKGQVTLNELVEACMLEGGCMLESAYDSVKMHDLMRDMAIGITRKSPIFMVKAGIGLENVVADKEWVEDAERISLMRNKIKMLSGEPPKCPKLLTLFLNDNPISHFESHSFFHHMTQLRVLDLSDTHIEELPESLSDLEKLNALRLGDCKKLKSVPCLAKLKRLRQLDLSYTCIEELPEGMEELVELTKLELQWTVRLKRFPIEILPRLSLLEYFNMENSSFLRSSSSCNVGEIKEAKTGFEEFTRLTQLSFLRLRFADISSFLKFVASMRGSISKIKEFALRVINSNTSLKLYTDRHSGRVAIMKCEDMKTRLPQFLLDLEFVEVLAYFDIDGGAYTLQRVINYIPRLSRGALQKGISLDGTSSNLQILFIVRCHKLKSLFSLRTLQNLQNLKKVEIKDCIAMEEVVTGEEDEKTGFNIDVILPNLKSIKLFKLPALQSICSRTMVCSSLINIDIASCSRLKKIPLIIDKPRPDDFVAKLIGTREWWDALDWANLAHTKDLLESSFIEE